jgi:hypothetical protein
MISMAVGLIAMTAMASLFRIGMNSTILLEQRVDTQENMRAAIDIMARDISLAGAGVPSGGIQLPTGIGNNGLSKYGCDQGGTCHVVNNTYPPNGASTNYMYGIIPGYLNGVESGAAILAAPAPAVNDSITVVYCDYNFPLFQYKGVFSNVNGTAMTLTPIAGDTPPAINGAGGVQVGDLVMVSGASLTAVGEVTNISWNSTTSTGTIDFGNGDPLNINQSGAASGNLAAIANAAAGGSVSVIRLYVVTYYLTTSTATYAGAPQTVRLMRQVNGLTPVPVADSIINLQIAYDTYNSTTNALDANEVNPIGVGESPNNIQKINLLVMGESINSWGNKSQNSYLATDISARNMSFRNRYD